MFGPKGFSAMHYLFLFNLLYHQGSLKIIILGAGEGAVKLAGSHTAGGRGRPAQHFLEAAWQSQELGSCPHLLTHNRTLGRVGGWDSKYRKSFMHRGIYHRMRWGRKVYASQLHQLGLVKEIRIDL